MGKVIIIIPVYKDAISLYEEISLKQCFRILGGFPITLACSHDLNVSIYLNLAEKFDRPLCVERFDNTYFEDVKGYNKLMLSVNFYKRFVNYKYILIHQTDAFVFRNELEHWCDLDYDYIGAPWLMDIGAWLNVPGAYLREIKLFYKIFGANRMNRTGNGGLSLRKTETFINNLSFFKFWTRRWPSNEDNFFSHCLSILNFSFRIPPLNKSLQFSFDSLPQQAYEKNNFQLPFGCHAWNRMDGYYKDNITFWKQFIAMD